MALISVAPTRSQTLIDRAAATQQLTMTVVAWSMLVAPYAVFWLVARLMIEIGFDALRGMAAYVATVLAGLALLMAFYLTLVALLADRSPLAFLVAARDALLLAFSTSGAAAMPLSRRSAEERLRVRPEVARFVVPIGATVNMAGAALYRGLGDDLPDAGVRRSPSTRASCCSWPRRSWASRSARRPRPASASSCSRRSCRALASPRAGSRS
ncbi:MAG: dicarboxylate/amino acid:cation symporter [Chloroflexi bacterium]|nr:dicarboxylate/amino acid:cation symporter [Chloroflexota bacterium]